MAVYDALREDLFTGVYEPGSKLKIEALRQRYGVGTNLIRESLARLASDGLVEAEEQKGFRVTKASGARLADLTRMRVLLETDGIKHSLQDGDINWEVNLVAAHHKLVHIEQRMHEDPDRHLITWQQCDYEFHAALIAACGSQLHCEHHRRVFDQFRQFIQLELRTHGFRGTEVVHEHEAILEAALKRDAARCAEEIEKHLGVYLNRIQSGGRAGH